MDDVHSQDERMPHIEEERRFLVDDVSVYFGAQSELITQAYFIEAEGLTYRLRVTEDETSGDESASACMKGPRADGKRREDEAPLRDVELAKQIIAKSVHVVRKRRHSVLLNKDETWSFDEFLDENSGLVIAELEGGDGIWTVPVPDWALREVTFEDQYNNEVLAFYPMRTRWKTDSPFRHWLAARGEDQVFGDPDFD